ncbi:tRNA (N6-isopentenyl adenosine(37)-C2)-methylthiotransferase MiaB [Hyphomicrobium sp. ghe19]|uniref:tRNA (N6-isopentenyl adenosine(37)-C2)-methylthiotransferase MiaB n=1 Tax=Hyphomicrobium sp. ghe19 TaxID=2682968 RepID=UPI0013677804|nr:tRNA-2-methylthio-N(6)-dimethylallyladenosine synthase [Hyphomicrobium sp. ghe19]
MQRANPKTYFLKTFGCQMNVYDSERMAEALARDGYSQTDDVGNADLVILNTCHIREKAAEKVYSDLGRIRDIKDARKHGGKETVIAVAGCVAQAEGSEITRRQPAVDLVIGPQSYHRLPELIVRAETKNERIVETEFPGDEKFTAMKAPRRVSSPSAFLTVQEGCDKFCTFCVVPYTRGAEFSRPVAKLEAEVRELAVAGAKELVLLGQNVNAYHGEGPSGRAVGLAELIRRLAEIDGIERIRYMTSHPRDMSDDLIAAHAEVPQLMPFLHLPVQSGSDRMLTAMNRKHRAAEYIDLIARVRAARPDIALSSDFIVGFPGETDEDAEETIALVKAVGFAQAFSFKYSPRPGTPAAGLEVQVPEDVKTARLHRLQALLDEQQTAFNAKTLGSTMPVLFERPGRNPGEFVGRSPYLQLVHAVGDGNFAGQTANVAVTETRRVSLSGVIPAA